MASYAVIITYYSNRAIRLITLHNYLSSIRGVHHLTTLTGLFVHSYYSLLWQ